MKLIVGAPVAERAWALPKWFDCLRAQTLRPDGFVFAYSRSDDDTAKLLGRHSFGSLHVDYVEEAYISRRVRHEDRGARAYGELAQHRNRLMKLALEFDADMYLSLDTDVFLTDPTTISRLVGAITAAAGDLSSVRIYLSRQGPALPTYNAGWWRTTDQDSPTRAWDRVTEDDVKASYGAFGVDIPMAVVMMPRDVLERCQGGYCYHESGEDLGFAQELDRQGLKTIWLTDINPPHVMDPAQLEEMV